MECASEEALGNFVGTAEGATVGTQAMGRSVMLANLKRQMRSGMVGQYGYPDTPANTILLVVLKPTHVPSHPLVSVTAGCCTKAPAAAEDDRMDSLWRVQCDLGMCSQWVDRQKIYKGPYGIACFIKSSSPASSNHGCTFVLVYSDLVISITVVLRLFQRQGSFSHGEP